MEEPDANLKKKKIGEPDVELNGRHAQEESANESSLAGCVAAVNNLLCDMPTVDLSRDRTALSG